MSLPNIPYPGGQFTLPEIESRKVIAAEQAARGCGVTEATINYARAQLAQKVLTGQVAVPNAVGDYVESLRLMCVGIGGKWDYQLDPPPGQLPPVPQPPVPAPPQPGPPTTTPPQPQPPAPPKNGNGRRLTRGQALALAAGATVGGAAVGGVVGLAVGESGHRGRHALTGAVAGAGVVGAFTGLLAAVARP